MDVFTEHVVLVLRDALQAYDELAETLPTFLAAAPDPAYDADIIKAYRAVSMEVARTLAIANRSIDDMRVAGYLEDESVILIQPILRMIGESFLLLALSKSKEEILKAPLIDPQIIKRMSGNKKVQALVGALPASA